MKAGPLNHEVVIQSLVPQQGASLGDVKKVWQTFHSCWAAIEPLSGREYLLGGYVGSNVTTRIRIRSYDGVNNRMRVKYGTRTFEIVSVLDIRNDGDETHLMCTEVFNGT